MSRISCALISLVLIILLSVFFFLSPRFFTQKAVNQKEILNKLLSKRFKSLGHALAHASFVEDAIIMGEEANLSEIITRLKKDEPDIKYIHFTNKNGMVIASTMANIVGKKYSSNLGKSGQDEVQEKNGTYEGAFKITVGKTQIGTLYLGATPEVPHIKVATSSNPMILVVGIIVGLIAFFITFSSGKNLEAKLIEDINKRQEEVFSPKIESLKSEQENAQKRLDEINSRIERAKEELKKLNEDYEARKQEFENSPVMQSIEKLKVTEAELLKRLETLKQEEQSLKNEVALLNQKREEVRSTLEAEKKEEKNLHEKLDLIKKKILHLETPGK